MDKSVRRLLDAFAKARLCYGEPVRQGDVTVIPVSRVKVSGGWGVGGPAPAKSNPGRGGGGGGTLEAQPAGFVEIGPNGARFHEIADPERTQRLVKTGAAALTAVLAGVAGVRGLRARRGPAGLLRAGR